MDAGAAGLILGPSLALALLDAGAALLESSSTPTLLACPPVEERGNPPPELNAVALDRTAPLLSATAGVASTCTRVLDAPHTK